MKNLPIKYNIVYTDNETGTIKADHVNKKLLISKDINLNVTDDGKLNATFKNFRKNDKKSVFERFFNKTTDTDCSLVISNHSDFNYCVQKDGIYHLSGTNMKFTGTDNDDLLILNGCKDSKINMGEGNDCILYHDKRVINNNIELGNGNNMFLPAGVTGTDRAMVNNKITSGKGHDFIQLRNAIGNKIYTGSGNDLVEIKGAPQTIDINAFKNNLIYTDKGDDKICIQGKFDNLQNNKFYLGKGNDTLTADINKDNDRNNELDYLNKILGYNNLVSGTTIYANDDKKGLFEKDMFYSKTYSANKLKLSGFESENVKCKPIPKDKPIVINDTKPAAPKKLTADDYKRMYWLNSLGYNLFKDPKMQEAAFKAVEGFVYSWYE